MILKNADDRSGDIAELERLKETAPPSFHAAIQKEIHAIRRGRKGEADAAHFIDRAYGASDTVGVLHDLRIGHEGDFAQMDHVVIHRVQGAAWVLETKNYSGRLTCDEHGDWTVWYGSKPQSIESPVSQARRHCQTLRLWLEANGVTAIRSFHPVVLISPKSRIDRRKLPKDVTVVKSDNFDDWMSKQAEKIGVVTAFGMVGRYVLGGLSKDGLEALGQRLVSAHIPASYDWHARLRLPQEPVEPAATRPGAPQHLTPAAAESTSGDAPQVISTPHGEVRISRIPDGRYALRNDRNEALIEIVRNACKGAGQWNPRYRNWLVTEDKLPAILAQIER